MSEAKRPHNKLEIDESFIKENYGEMSAREIGEILGVSRSAINHRVRKMGLRKTQIPYVPLPVEIVKTLTETDRYGVTNYSRVINLHNMTELKQKIDGEGYKKVTLYINGKQVGKRVHRLVAIHFIPNPFNLPQVNHIDGVKSNSFIDNLEWVTAKGNAEHASKTGLLKVGERHPSSKISEEQARDILNDYYECENIKKLIERHPYASESIIRKICDRSRWKHLDRSFERPTTIPFGGEIPQQEYGASDWRG